MKRFFGLLTVVAAGLAACDGSTTGITAPESGPPQVISFDAGGTGSGGMIGSATVATDKLDYFPGDTVTISGTGWTPGETVALVITEDPSLHVTTIPVTADAAGSFLDRSFLIDASHLGVSFTLTATGGTSGATATTAFTDARVIDAVTLSYMSTEAECTAFGTGSPSTCSPATAVSLPGGATFSAEVGVTTTAPGGNPWKSTAWLASTASTTTHAALVCVEHGDHTTAGTYSETLSLTAPAAPGTYNVFFAAFQADGCAGGNPSVIVRMTSALVVEAPPPSNTPPVADGGGPYSGDEGSAISLNGATASDADDDPLTYEWTSSSALCTFDDATLLNPDVTCADNGSYTVTLTVDDGTVTASSNATVTVANVAPTATFNAPASVNEGDNIDLSLTGVSDPSSVDVAAGFVYAFDCGDGAGYGSYSASSSTTCTTTDDGSRTVKGKVRDKDLGESEYTASVTINDVPPAITSLTTPVDPYAVNTVVPFSGAFTGPSVDTHTITVACGGPVSGSTGSIDQALDTFSGTCTYTGAGLYKITVTITDDDGSSDSRESELVVVYDPSAGFVTGGGWIQSAPGAYKPDQSLGGKANFGFVSKYLKGATVPTGNTEFQFHAGGLNFHSSSYQWLVVNQGGTNAQFKGTGTLNGQGGYGFMLWAVDGSPDSFRIKIWLGDENNANDVVYDNGFNQSIGGGSIVIHTGGKK